MATGPFRLGQGGRSDRRSVATASVPELSGAVAVPTSREGR